MGTASTVTSVGVGAAGTVTSTRLDSSLAAPLRNATTR